MCPHGHTDQFPADAELDTEARSALLECAAYKRPWARMCLAITGGSG